jgi:hypothetical protein
MDKKPLIIINIGVVVLLVLISLNGVAGYQTAYDIHHLDPGWIRGPIWGRIDGYEFLGTETHATLLFYAKNVHYFGIGHAFNAGLYPRHWVNEEVSAYYSYFEGIITEHIIFGKISGLPNQ